MIFYYLTWYNYFGDNMRLAIYIIYIMGLLIGLFFLNQKINLKYKDFSINNLKIYLECLLINLTSLIYGKNYFSFSIYLVAIIMIYLYYLKKDIKSIPDEDKKVRLTAVHFVKHFIIIVLINIPVFFISNLKIIGYTFFSIVAILVIICLDTMIVIKKKETYTLKTPEEIQTLFPNYDINNLYNALYNTVASIKNNYMNNKVDDSINNLSEEIYNEYKLKEKNNIAKKQKELFEELNYVSGGLINYDETTKTFKVELVYSYKNYTVDINTGNVLSGTAMFPKRCTYVIEFIYTDKVIIKSEKLVNSI